MSISLRSNQFIDPRHLFEGNLGSWIRLILYCGLFITLVNSVFSYLPQFRDNPYAKKLGTFLGFILGIGLFLAEKIFNFNFESFAFLGIWFVIILFGIVAFGLFRAGMSADKATALAYCVIYLSFLAISPSLFDSINNFFPLLNLILFLLFIYLAVSAISGLVKSKIPNLKSMANSLKKNALHYDG